MIEGGGWQAIDAGRVYCARRDAEVDLSRCLECNWLLDLDRSSADPALRCVVSGTAPAAERPGAAPTDRHID